MLKRISLLLLPIYFLLLFSCVGPPSVFLRSPQLNEKIQPVHKIVLLPPEVEVYQLSAGGVSEKIGEWSKQARQNLVQSLQDLFNGQKNIDFEVINEDSLNKEQKVLITALNALYDAINTSLLIHVYGRAEDRFSEKIKNFDYSFGPDVQQLDRKADAYLFLSSIEYLPSAGRQALQIGAVVVGALLGAIVVPTGDYTLINVALVDAKTGDILWHNKLSSMGGFHLTSTKAAPKLVKSAFKHFPVKLK